MGSSLRSDRRTEAEDWMGNVDFVCFVTDKMHCVPTLVPVHTKPHSLVYFRMFNAPSKHMHHGVLNECQDLVTFFLKLEGVCVRCF